MNNVSTTILGVAVASKQVSILLSSSPFPSSLSRLATSTRHLVTSGVNPPRLAKPKPHAPSRLLPPPTERDAPPSLPGRTAQVQVRTRVKLKEEEKTGREKVHGAGIMHKGRRLAPEHAREDGARMWSKEQKPGVIRQAPFAVASPAKTKTKTNCNKSARVVNRRTAECTGEVCTSETGSEESDFTGSDEEDIPWISWFCSLRGNKFFCEVDEEFIQDAFNLSGLSSQVPYYDLALDLILDVDSPSDNGLTKVPNETVESAAEMLYGLIHARYILTSKGLSLMLEKYKNGDFGWCPRVLCTEQPCLPVGQSDIARTSPVKIYCPKCQDIYYPKSEGQASIDGSYFGTTFPHLFLMTFPFAKPPKPTQLYIPRIYGFKIHQSVR